MPFTRILIITIVGLFGTLSGGSLVAQNAWETLPVFHNGRMMPLHTFARQIVREICGTERPFLIRDDAVIADFSRVVAALQQQDEDRELFGEEGERSTEYRFLNPSATLDGGFGRNYSIFKLADDAQQIQTTLPIQGLDRAQIERLANRVRQLVPLEGRYFDADELLLSWICEPEVWAYIPIFRVPDADYLNEFFDVSFARNVRTSQYRLSLHQLEKSQRYKQRCTEIQRQQELGQFQNNPSLSDQITVQLQYQTQAFLDLTFHPQWQRPTRMISLLRQVASERSSYSVALDRWGDILSFGEIPGRRATERALMTDDMPFFHPTTLRWHDIADKLRFLMQIYDRTDSAGNAILPRATVVEQQYEMLIDLIDTNLAEAAALMEAVYPGISYRLTGSNHAINIARLLPTLQSPENQQNQATIRRIALSYYYSVKKLRSEIEQAYLALYDNGRSLRFLPLVLEAGNLQNNPDTQPWASAAMILGSGETFIQHFFEPKFVRSTVNAPTSSIVTEEDAPPMPDETEDADDADAESEPKEEPDIVIDIKNTDPASLERALFQTPVRRTGNIRLIQSDQSLIGKIRIKAKELLFSYTAQGGGKYGGSDFQYQASQFQQTVYEAAAHIEKLRKSLIDAENRQVSELLEKTAYPDSISSKKLLTEYRYDRLLPFFWLGMLALTAFLINIGAYIVAATRDKSVVAKTVSVRSVVRGEQNETELSDHTNSIEEWLFISSVVVLMFAIVIAIMGGVMRSIITGWVPVTNMYETVVMMALAAAILGVWYALYPLLSPAWRLAWTCSKLPELSALREWCAAMKEKKAVFAAHQTEESPLGRHHTASPKQDTQEWEAEQHVSAAAHKIAGQCLLTLPRLVLTFALFYWIVLLSNGSEYVAQHGVFASAGNVFAASDAIDSLTVSVCVLLILWYVPHALLALLMTPFILFRPAWIAAEQGIQSFETKIIVETASKRSEKPLTIVQSRSEMSEVFMGEARRTSRELQNTSGVAWLKQARNAALDRKLFIAITAGVVFVVALIAQLNRAEFNPDFRPIAAVLRSNFWLAVHVIAIIVSYAAAFIAWGIAVVSLGYAALGRYRRIKPEYEGARAQVLLPASCQMFTPVIEILVKIALLLLIVGTVLGARWADYSWGRFWSWDPKEVWALITILFFVIVVHGKAARYYGAIGITTGALFASIAVMFTWYGINFIFSSGRHAYGSETLSNATIFFWVFIIANLLWGTLALLRYTVEVYGNEPTEENG